jgi:acetylglutamate kinase
MIPVFDQVIKLGGRGLIDSAILETVAAQISELHKRGLKVAVVHGGGPAINEELTRRGIAWSFIDGQRVTTPEMMDVIEMVLCGSMNRKVVRALRAVGVDAVGFSGVDGGTLLCEQLDSRLQLVGAVERVRIDYVTAIMRAGGVPVLAPIGGSESGLVYNINADWAAAKLAGAVRVEKMVFLTDQEGILNGDGKLIPSLSIQELNELIEKGVVQGGMLTKARAVIHALENGVDEVVIRHASLGPGTELPLATTFKSGVPMGTRCYAEYDSLDAKSKDVDRRADTDIG